MKFGMLHLFENPVGKSEHQLVHEQLTLMRAAEDYGFDSVWPAEHHFSEYGELAKAQGVYGFTDLLCWTRLGGLDHRKVLRSMDLMSTKVFPHLRQLEPPALPESL